MKRRFSDLILIDTSSCNKYLKNQSVVFISGLDIEGEVNILFTAIISKKMKEAYEVILDHFHDAGFAQPKYAIIDTMDFQ
jgi:predicted nucleic acid-binding protein